MQQQETKQVNQRGLRDVQQRPKTGFEDKRIVHNILNKQSVEEMSVGMMMEIIKDNVGKGLGLGPYSPSQIYRTISVVEEPTKVQTALGTFLKQISLEQQMYGRQVKVRESVEKVFKPEYIAVQGTSETGTRSDGTMVNCLPSLNEQKRMGLGRSEDIYQKYRNQISIRYHYCKKCRNQGHLEKDCPFK